MPRIKVKNQKSNKQLSLSLKYNKRKSKLKLSSLRYKYKNQISKKLMRTRYKILYDELRKRNLKLGNVIDRGAFGVVYRANNKYAVKITRSYNEYTCVKKVIENNIKHDNMVKYIDCFSINENNREDYVYVIVMELVKGRDQCRDFSLFTGFSKKRKELSLYLGEYNIEMSDDGHSGNVGIKNGTLKFFDIF